MADVERTVIKLQKPISRGSETITELAFRPVCGKDFRQLRARPGYHLDTILALAGRLSGQPDDVIDRLTGDDLAEVIALVAGFMPGGQTTGSEDSQS